MSSANQCPGGAIRANLALTLGFGGLACRIIIRGGRGIMLGLTRLAFQLLREKQERPALLSL
jgi:hypothetical protein